MFIKTYQQLIFRVFLKIFLRVLGIFFALVFTISMFDEINYANDLEKTIIFPITLTILNSPSILYELFPFIFLITTQFFS